MGIFMYDFKKLLFFLTIFYCTNTLCMSPSQQEASKRSFVRRAVGKTGSFLWSQCTLPRIAGWYGIAFALWQLGKNRVVHKAAFMSKSYAQRGYTFVRNSLAHRHAPVAPVVAPADVFIAPADGLCGQFARDAEGAAVLPDVHVVRADAEQARPAVEAVAEDDPRAHERVLCNVCLDYVERRDTCSAPCGHITYCRDCLLGPDGAIAHAIHDHGTESLRCRTVLAAHDEDAGYVGGVGHVPRRCGCILDTAKLLKMIPDERQRSALEEVILQECLDKDPELRHCPKADCPYAFFAEAGVALPVRCPACHEKYCSACLQLHRPGERCHRENAAWVAQHTRPCPRCHVAIEKNQGCDHMHCRRCGLDFSWTHAERADLPDDALPIEIELTRADWLELVGIATQLGLSFGMTTFPYVRKIDATLNALTGRGRLGTPATPASMAAWAILQQRHPVIYHTLDQIDLFPARYLSVAATMLYAFGIGSISGEWRAQEFINITAVRLSNRLQQTGRAIQQLIPERFRQYVRTIFVRH